MVEDKQSSSRLLRRRSKPPSPPARCETSSFASTPTRSAGPSGPGDARGFNICHPSIDDLSTDHGRHFYRSADSGRCNPGWRHPTLRPPPPGWRSRLAVGISLFTEVTFSLLVDGFYQEFARTARNSLPDYSPKCLEEGVFSEVRYPQATACNSKNTQLGGCIYPALLPS